MNRLCNNVYKKYNIISYLKKLNTQLEYDAFKDSDEFVTPNVSLIVDGKIVMYNKKKGISNNEIRYTSNTNTVVQPYNNNFGGSNVISNTYENGVGIITFDTDVTEIGRWAFDGCSSLTSITIPNSVTLIGSWAFNGCSSLTSITIPNSVTSIGDGAFSGCTELTSIIVDKNNPIYDSRDNCNAIIKTESNVLLHGCKNTVIPNSVIGPGISAFRDCSGLTSITIPNSVTKIGAYAFKGSGLTSITIPYSVTMVYELAFTNCKSLTSVVWNAVNCSDFASELKTAFRATEDKITSFEFGDGVEHIPAYMCYNMSNINSIEIPNSVVSVGRYAFNGCSGLTSVVIGNSVTSIGSLAFRDCDGLTTITIPNSVTSIGKSAFYSCSNLTSVTFNSAIPPSLGSAKVFTSTPSNLIIYVPDESVDTYKAAEYWSSYASKIKPISEKQV